MSATQNQLSALIEQVRQGVGILITDHDRPVARLIPVVVENGQSDSDELALRRGRPFGTSHRACAACSALQALLKNASRRGEILGLQCNPCRW